MVYKFEAQGLYEITGPMDGLPTAGQIRRLFPKFTDCKDLVGTDAVDYLIGI